MKSRTLPKTKPSRISAVTAMILALPMIMTLLLLPPKAVPQAPPIESASLPGARAHAGIHGMAGASPNRFCGCHPPCGAGARGLRRRTPPRLPLPGCGPDHRTRDKVSNELAPAEDLKKVFESLGVGDGTQVILYGERQGLWAARAWFTLDYLGHGDKAALLDGNIEKWRRENRPLTTDASPIKPAIFSPHVQPGVLVTLPMMRDLSWPGPQYHFVAGDTLGCTPTGTVSRRGKRIRHAASRPHPRCRSLYWMTTLKSTGNPQMLTPGGTAPPLPVRGHYSRAQGCDLLPLWRAGRIRLFHRQVPGL